MQGKESSPNAAPQQDFLCSGHESGGDVPKPTRDPMGVQRGDAVGGSCLSSELLPDSRAQRSTMKNMYNCGLGPKSQQTPCHTKSQVLGSGSVMTFFL